MNSERRTFNTPERSSWNEPIRNILKVIDLHTSIYLQTGNPWHERKAALLRTYINDLKTHILTREQKERSDDR
jgi:hypothetical protein